MSQVDPNEVLARVSHDLDEIEERIAVVRRDMVQRVSKAAPLHKLVVISEDDDSEDAV